MHRKLILSLSLVFTVAAVTSTGADDEQFSAEKSSTKEPSPVANDPSPENKPKARITYEDAKRTSEILELRERLGGLLEGSLLETEANEANADQTEFLDELRQLEQSPQPTQRCEREYQIQINRQQTCTSGCCVAPAKEPRELTVARSNRPWQPVAESNFAASMRAAARELDNRANDLEEVDDYGRADHLRQLADQLRQAAREARHESNQAYMTPETATQPGKVFHFFSR